jgi:hypothetical protein
VTNSNFLKKISDKLQLNLEETTTVKTIEKGINYGNVYIKSEFPCFKLKICAFNKEWEGYLLLETNLNTFQTENQPYCIRDKDYYGSNHLKFESEDISTLSNNKSLVEGLCQIEEYDETKEMSVEKKKK